MQSKSLILLIVALACGVVASVGITQVMAHRTTSAPAQKLETLPVFVVKSDIPLGTMLDAEKLKLEQWPKDKVPEGVLGKLEDIEGRRPRTKLFAGEPILDVKLLSKGESAGGASPQIPVGYRSVPVRVDEVSGGAAMILPGDRVDVLVYAKQQTGISATLTKTILQDIRVFAIDSQWTMESDESGKTIRAKTISLLLTPEQTERVMLAHELGKIRLALRSPNDHEEAELPDGGHRVGQIFGDMEIADRESDSTLALIQAPPEPLPAVFAVTPERPSHTVRVISGSRVQQVVMQSEADEEASIGPTGSGVGNGSGRSLFWEIISSPGPATGSQDKTELKKESDSEADTEPNSGSDEDLQPEPGPEVTALNGT